MHVCLYIIFNVELLFISVQFVFVYGQIQTGECVRTVVRREERKGTFGK